MQTTRALITAPTDSVIAIDDVKAHLRVAHDDEDEVIQGCFDAAVSLIDPAAGGFLGRALRPQTWEYRLDAFPYWGTARGASHAWGWHISLPYPPLIAVISVKYDDSDGVEQTLVENTDFRVTGLGTRHRARIEPVFGKSWPSARCQAEAVRIRYSCGHPVAAAGPPVVVETFPPGIRHWLLLVTGTFYENRELMAPGRNPMVALPEHVRSMIYQFRAY